MGSRPRLGTRASRSPGPALHCLATSCELGFAGLTVSSGMPLRQDVAVACEVAAPGEHGDQLRRVGGLGGGVLVWPGGVAEPQLPGVGGDRCGDRGALVIGEAAVDVGGDLRACLVVC